MALNDLLPELLRLSHEEKLHAIEILQDEVAHEDNPPNSTYASFEVWSPQVTPETARELLDMLREDKAKHG